MKDLIALSRAMKLYYHHLHNIANGACFSSDHSMMSGFYKELDNSYDSLVERFIGLGNKMDKSELVSFINESVGVLEEIPEGDDMIVHFNHALSLEDSLRAELKSAKEGASCGTENLLEGLADQSEVRAFKLNQRVK